MFFMQNFKGFPMQQLLFKLSCGAQGFFPAKRAFCPFWHIYARALYPKIDIPQATQAKINIFCVQFQELSIAVFPFQPVVCDTGVFSRQISIFRLCSKKKLKSDFQAHRSSIVYQLCKMLYFGARNLGMPFKLRFYHSTQCRRDAAFHVFGKKKWKESPMQNFVGGLFPHRGKCSGFVQEFRYWGQNPLCRRSYSVTRNKRGIRLMISGTV